MCDGILQLWLAYDGLKFLHSLLAVLRQAQRRFGEECLRVCFCDGLDACADFFGANDRELINLAARVCGSGALGGIFCLEQRRERVEIIFYCWLQLGRSDCVRMLDGLLYWRSLAPRQG